MTADKYSNFPQLKSAEPAEHWRVVSLQRNGPVVVIAPHGGSIEPGTSEIARAIAADDLSLYLFEGLKVAGNRDLHITSAKFDEPVWLELASSAPRVVAVHGEGRDPASVVYLGGRDEHLGAAVREQLTAAGFTVKAHDDPDMQGISPANICNRGSTGAGVQLELTRALREELFASLTPAGRMHPTDRLKAFPQVVRQALADT